MGLHCPGVIVCLEPGTAPPSEAGGFRLTRVYTRGVEPQISDSPVPVSEAPEGMLWDVIQTLGDIHVGEAIALYLPTDLVQSLGLNRVCLTVDKHGPRRLPPVNGCG